MYHKSVKEVLEEFKTSKDGLSENEVKKRIEQYGKNELPKKKNKSVFMLFIGQFYNPIEMILVVTLLLSFATGEYVDAFALLIIILIDVLMGTYQEWKALKDAQSLINMIKSTTYVIRNGKEYEVESSELVPGDIIALESGSKISVDARIIDCHNFQVDESTLTGESIAVLKNERKLADNTPLSERANMVFAGTSVVTGRCKAVVVSTGIHMEIGKIARKVTETEEEKSPLTIRMEKFSKQISAIIVIVAILTALVLVYKNYPGNQIFLCVIALAVSAMPEGLPLALTMALTIASKRMAKKNVIVKKLNSVEALGSCTVIASDKTGTLTVNEQTAKEIVLPNGEVFEITGTGYNDEGRVKSVGDANIDHAREIGVLGAINNEAILEKEDDDWRFLGDSIDIAFLSMAKKLKIESLPEVVEMIPYESENQYSAAFYKVNDKLYCTVKGSLEVVMSFSEEKEKYKKQNEELTKRGFRVIALASGEVKGTSKKDVKDLKFKGLVAFIDPIREEVKDSLKECDNAGIKVVMITGDHPLTAFAIAKDLGLCKDFHEVATGDDVAKYRAKGEKEFDDFVKSIRVFSRVTPLDKLDIVNSFKRQGEFVAVTGDGVNDAPAIKAANIGIAMGSGTDVAKETASMIIGNDDFTSIVLGVKEGRTAYANIRKITLFLLSCGFAEIMFFLLSILFGYDIPLVAIQLLWLNMVTDGLQDVALSFELAEDNIMNEKPRATNESLFSKDLMMEILVLGLTITIIVFGVWKYMMDKNYDIIYARAATMMLMVFIQNINVLNCRSEHRTVFKEKLRDNPLITITILGSILLQLFLAEIPITAKFLKVAPLPADFVLILFALSLLIIVVSEVYKFFYRRSHKES